MTSASSSTASSAKLFLETTLPTGEPGYWEVEVTGVGKEIKRPLCLIFIVFCFQFIWGFATSRKGIPKIMATFSANISNLIQVLSSPSDTSVMAYAVVFTVWPSANLTVIPSLGIIVNLNDSAYERLIKLFVAPESTSAATWKLPNVSNTSKSFLIGLIA